MQHLRWLIMLGTVSTACTTARVGLNDTKFAHIQGPSIIGSPIGQVYAMDHGLFGEQRKFRICLQNESSLNDADLLLETELAYAMWLNNVTAAQLARFEFQLKADCLDQASQFNSLIYVTGATSKIPVKIAEQTISFPKPVAFCKKISSRTLGGQSRTSVQCANNFNSAKGSAAALKILREEPSQKWVQIEVSFPAFIVTSPYLNWQSLREANFKNDANKVVAAEISAEYDRLLSKEQRTLADFATLKAILQKHRVIAEEPTFPRDLIENFRKSADEEQRIPYTPIATLLPTLLHEAGHQFGMLHADNPPETGAINERTITATMNEQGRWVTKNAVMAYGDPYIYLEEDDQRGIESVVQEVLRVLKENTGQSERTKEQ